MRRICGTISFQNATRGPKGEENRERPPSLTTRLEPHSTSIVNVVTLQAERRDDGAKQAVPSRYLSTPAPNLDMFLVNDLANWAELKDLHFLPMTPA